MALLYFKEIIQALSIMDYVKFFAVLAVVLVGMWVFVVKHKIRAKESTDVAKITEASKLAQVSVLAAVVAFLFKK